MTDAPSGVTPALRRLEVAAALRKHRKAARLTTAQVTRALGFSASKLSRIETGNRPVQLVDLKALCDLYEVTPAEQDYLARLVDESRRASEWHAIEDFEAEDIEYMELEAAAYAIDDYKTSIVSALIQTADYTRALRNSLAPNTPSDVIEELVRARAVRQRDILGRADPVALSFVMDEGALHRIVGSNLTMKGQLLHISEMSRRPNINFRVIPFTAGAHIGMESLFTILSFKQDIRDRVYIDGLAGAMYRVDTKEIQRYRTAFSTLQAQAMNPNASRTLVLDLARAL